MLVDRVIDAAWSVIGPDSDWLPVVVMDAPASSIPASPETERLDKAVADPTEPEKLTLPLDE